MGPQQKEAAMTQYMYTDQIANKNITYGILGRGSLANNKNLRDLSNHTVIIVTDEFMDQSMMRATAEAVLVGGCKNVAFCGEASDEWQALFTEMDQEINGFNDITGYEDFAVMWRFEDIDNLLDAVSTCWNEVLILCSSMALVRECQEELKEEHI